MDYGRVRLWAPLRCCSALVGKLVSLCDCAILACSIGIASMLLGMLRPSVMPQGEKPPSGKRRLARMKLVRKKLAFSGLRLPASGAHAAYYGFSAIYWQGAGYSASAVGYLWSAA